MRFLTALTFLLLLLPRAVSANPQASTIDCKNLNNLQEPVITLIEDDSRGRYIGKIYSDGRVYTQKPSLVIKLPIPTSSPEPVVERNRLSPLTVQALLRLANAEGFWQLPSSNIGSAVDAQGFFLASYRNSLIISLPCARRTVGFKSNAVPQPFKELYSLLKDLLP